jgi:hypothetical protein
MLQDFDKTLEKIIYTEGKIPKSDVDIAFDAPDGEWSSRLSKPTINCWCFDVRENLKLRATERQVTVNGQRADVKMPLRRFDLTYLVTAWARKMEDEHQLLWRALTALKRTTSIKPRDSEGSLRYLQFDIPLLVATPSDHPVNLVDLWGVLNNVMRVGFTVVATLEMEVFPAIDTPLVLEGRARVGFAENPPSKELTLLDAEMLIASADKTDPSDENGSK